MLALLRAPKPPIMIGRRYPFGQNPACHIVDIVSKLQVFGFISSGWTLPIYRMSFVSPRCFVMRKSETFVLPLKVQVISFRCSKLLLV